MYLPCSRNDDCSDCCVGQRYLVCIEDHYCSPTPLIGSYGRQLYFQTKQKSTLSRVFLFRDRRYRSYESNEWWSCTTQHFTTMLLFVVLLFKNIFKNNSLLVYFMDINMFLHALLTSFCTSAHKQYISIYIYNTYLKSNNSPPSDNKYHISHMFSCFSPINDQ